MNHNINLLEKRQIRQGENWILSEGFDVEPDLRSTERIDVALEDIQQLANSGAVVSILSHQRRFLTKPMDLDFVADYLTKKLGRQVKYFPDNKTEEAIQYARQMKNGEITIFGNTRFNEGEEKNDAGLARQFARFGDFAAIGGWCKSHRKNASNVGILDYIPGFMTRSLVREMQLLQPWAGKSDKYSAVVLGGAKKEKIKALEGFVRNYDAVIPGGIVLNTIYLVQGRKIGKSLIADEGKVSDKEVRAILSSENASKICIPEYAIIATNLDDYSSRKTIPISEGVPSDYMVVDFIMPDCALKSLDRVVEQSGRLVIAGTPGAFNAGFREATENLLKYANAENISAIGLGGDTIRDLKGYFFGTQSIGGGASLAFIASGTTEVYEALNIKNTMPTTS